MTNYEKLIVEIEKAYTEGVTLSEAEKLAAMSLFIMDGLSRELMVQDLNSRTRKQGVKAIKAAVRMEAITSAEKKPTESTIDAMVDMNAIVIGEIKSSDEAEVSRDELERRYSIAKEAHIHFRGVSRGTFG